MKELEEIYEQYFKAIYSFLYRLSGEKHLAEDLTSETFFKVMQSIQTFNGESDVKTWLFQIAKNTYFSYLRKEKSLIDIEKIEQKAPINIEKKFLLQEDVTRLYEQIHELPEPYKEVFYLRIFGELNFRQIGDLFGKTDNWACVTFHRARRKLRRDDDDYL